ERFTLFIDDGTPIHIVASSDGRGSHQVSGLSDGPHTFTVFATDRAGNVDPTPAEYDFVVTTVTPDTTILSGPDALTNADIALFVFESNLATPVTFKCKIDDGAEADVTATPGVPSSLQVHVSDGMHTFSVRAVSPGGVEDPTPAEYTWVVDRTPPTVDAIDLDDASDSGFDN